MPRSARNPLQGVTATLNVSRANGWRRVAFRLKDVKMKPGERYLLSREMAANLTLAKALKRLRRRRLTPTKPSGV